MDQIQEKKILFFQYLMRYKKMKLLLPPMTVIGRGFWIWGPNYKSGHCYFDVKDPVSSMAVIVWSKIYAANGITLQDR